MIWEELGNYISSQYEVVHKTEDLLVFYYINNEGKIITMMCSTEDDDFCEWLEISAQVCEFSPLNLHKMVSFHGWCLKPSGGIDILNKQIWVRLAYPFSLITPPVEEGPSIGTSLSYILYDLSGHAYIPD